MAETVIKYQCPACGGAMHFDANKQLVVCDYCESEYTEDYFKTAENLEEDYKKVDWSQASCDHEEEIMDEQTGFLCTSCGAEIVCDGNTVATECMYCGNPIVLKDNVSGVVRPDLVLPFKLDKKTAENKLRDFYNKKFLLPKEFKDQNRIRKIAGLYVPFWLFSGKGDGWLSLSAQKSMSHRDGDYVVTTTQHFAVERAGTVDFEKIPVDASTKMEDNYMDGLEPYDYSALEEFSPSYMAGYFADKFDVSAADCTSRAETRVLNSTANAIKDTVHGYTTSFETGSDVHFDVKDIKYALLPVWMLNTKYQDKMYHFAINGQTGKVSGDLPIDKKKKTLLQLGLTALAYIPLAIAAFMYFG